MTPRAISEAQPVRFVWPFVLTVTAATAPPTRLTPVMTVRPGFVPATDVPLKVSTTAAVVRSPPRPNIADAGGSESGIHGRSVAVVDDVAGGHLSAVGLGDRQGVVAGTDGASELRDL